MTERRVNRLIPVLLLGALWALAPSVRVAAEPEDRSPDEQARRTARTLLGRLGEGYTARFDDERRLLFVSALDEGHFRETAGLLAAFTDAMRQTLLSEPLKWNLTIVLPAADDYETLRPNEKVEGFYHPGSRTLISVDRGRVLVHELTHALHHADQHAVGQQHPPWIAEGIATLFDTCRIDADGLDPQVDIRLVTLKRAVERDELIALDELFELTRKQFNAPGRARLCYAEARYLLLYLHEQGKLADWYRAYRDGFDADPAGRKALTDVLGARLERIEEQWIAWIESLELPWGERSAGQGRLGLEIRSDDRGVKVVGMRDDSAAAAAGRIEVDDIITEFDGRAITNPAEYVAAVRHAGAMRTVTVKLVRHGREMTIHQPLGAPGSAPADEQ